MLLSLPYLFVSLFITLLSVFVSLLITRLSCTAGPPLTEGYASVREALRHSGFPGEGVLVGALCPSPAGSL